MALFPRYLTPTIKAALKDTPVVCLLGPRQVGKTTLAQQIDKHRAYISFDDANLLETAKLDPQGFVQALPHKVTLDEVQRVPELLPAIKLRLPVLPRCCVVVVIPNLSRVHKPMPGNGIGNICRRLFKGTLRISR
ncbi:MAG: putative AAA+ superfamily ATPase [Gammaproteobacteria bacterium]|jgi:predicted AAA+ superfamily ATPase